MPNIERDNEICRMYVAGSTLRDVGLRFQISYETVRKILKANGIDTTRRYPNLRAAYLAVDVPKSWKAAIRLEADRRKISMSALTTEALNWP